MNYLLYGTNDYVMNTESKKIITSNKINKDEIINYDYSEISIKDIIEDANTIPLFSDKKTIIVDNCTLFESTSKKEETSILETYLNNPNQNTILIFLEHTDKLDERKKIFKILKEKKQIIECNTLNINNLVKEQLQDYKINQTTINNLVNRVGTNPYNLINEIEKLKLFKINDKTITDEDIKFARKNIEDSLFDLIDYIINKNNEKIIELYHDLLLKNSEPIAILVLIANQIRLMYQCKTLYYQGYSEKDIAASLEVHPYRVKLAIEKARNYTNELLLNYLEDLAILDYEIKSGQKDADTGLELFLLDI